MRYLCLVYIDERCTAGMAAREYEAVAAECRGYEAALRESGHLLAMEALEPARLATTVRVRHGRVLITDSAFPEEGPELRWVYLLIARDLNDAIRLASSIPSVRLGRVEVRPVTARDDRP